jgi:small subunit ribosomal protein S27Ae
VKRAPRYSVEGEGVKRKGRFCPRCGMGVFMAEHVDRFHCGRCSYTEFKKGVPKFRAKPTRGKPKEEKKKEAPKKPEVKKEEPKKEEPKKEAPKEEPKKKSKKKKSLKKTKKR